MNSILNPKFRYTSAAATNIKLTFQRIRREIKEAQEKTAAKVQPIKAKK